MKLSEELIWRNFKYQTTYKDDAILDQSPITFYWGVDPSADSMTVGHLAIAMMVRHFIDHGHKAVLLVGGATGMIGDPDGKKQERDLKTIEEVQHNKDAIAAQYQRLFAGKDFETVDNYDWFKDLGYLEFLRTVGKHVPMRQMLGREFVTSRLSEDGAGISYAEFSYSLIQGYDFLHLYRDKAVTLQLCGADQWGNCVAGVDLIRRVTGEEASIWSAPLIINPVTGIKFGKSEAGAIWLDPAKTTPTEFYQFWINSDDAGVENYLKVYTLLSKDEIESIVAEHQKDPKQRIAQQRLAQEVTTLVHGEQLAATAQAVTDILVNPAGGLQADESVIETLRGEIPTIISIADGSVIEALTDTGLATSNSEARRLLQGNAISVNGQKITRENFESGDFQDGRLLLRRGKAFKDSALVELGK